MIFQISRMEISEKDLQLEKEREREGGRGRKREREEKEEGRKKIAKRMPRFRGEILIKNFTNFTSVKSFQIRVAPKRI